VVGDFCGSVATYARFLDPEIRDSVAAAYRRMPYSDAIAMAYFDGLRQTGIDLRDRLLGRFREDWSFAQPRLNAATCLYYLYLASLGEPGALDRLAEKIAATKDGNDATNLLRSLADLRAPGVAEVLRRYADDQRRADDPEGPGMTIAENVKLFLSMRPAE
jgi:hypothetical protein